MLSAGGREALIQGWDLSRFLPPSTPLFNQTFFILRERLLHTKLHRVLSLRVFSFIFLSNFLSLLYNLHVHPVCRYFSLINNAPCYSNIQPSCYSVWQPMPMSQLSQVRSQHPPTPWNLRAADVTVLKEVHKNKKYPFKKEIYIYKPFTELCCL